MLGGGEGEGVELGEKEALEHLNSGTEEGDWAVTGALFCRFCGFKKGEDGCKPDPPGFSYEDLK